MVGSAGVHCFGLINRESVIIEESRMQVCAEAAAATISNNRSVQIFFILEFVLQNEHTTHKAVCGRKDTYFVWLYGMHPPSQTHRKPNKYCKFYKLSIYTLPVYSSIFAR